MRIIIKNVMLVFLGVCSAILVSCQHAASDPDRIPSNEPPLMIVSTLQSYMTPISVFEYPDQVTDGKLLFSIELINTYCFDANKPIPIRMTISNLTNKTLSIPSDFSVAVNRKGAGGNLIPYITTLDGTNVLSLADHQLVDIFSTPSDNYMKIPTSESIEHEIVFYFPQDLVMSESSDGYQLATPTAGKYYIRLVYSEYERSADIWSGAIGSNRLEICVQN